MIADDISIKYIGGLTALFEVGGLQFLSDPTFDPQGTDYPTNIYTLHKISDPAIKISELHDIDFVLLSHDHHFDNLDNSGRSFLPGIKQVYTTVDGAKRLGGNAIGLSNWATI